RRRKKLHTSRTPTPDAFRWGRHHLGIRGRIASEFASGETMRSGRVSKRGDDFLRRSLYEAANALLTRIPRFSALKSWGLRIARRGGYRKAKIAVARKLA
ncbi:transposase, partial [Sinorhizobium medicae]|uniref:transposase n=1 Tax=Sinorhizobium medicae TaxID=110321 RepID=UPI00191761F9